jgi:hypothetical protein
MLPDIILTRPDGSPVRLSDLVTSPTLLVMLRHLA